MSNRLAHRGGRLDLRLPPGPPERGGGGGEPRRLHVVINIRVQPPPPRPRVSLFWLFVLSLILWSALA